MAGTRNGGELLCIEAMGSDSDREQKLLGHPGQCVVG
jgi:hypothetical protein